MAEDTPTPPEDFDPNDADAEAMPPTIEGRITDLAIERELADSYLTYAMSTIVDRALPDVRDGLKPSQRRILVAMNDLNLRPGSKHRKCAKISGDTSGNYHPHGDAVIYPTLVNMAQDWKMRYPLIDPQGNFGSIDPDPPAAMRYTEARMAPPAAEMLDDLKLDTVEWQENFDATTEEPRYLPGRFPNLLVNGGQGIAVGMATSLAPHNLGEVCDAIHAPLANPDNELPELISHMPGPDFPTGGIVMGRGGVLSAYKTGRGRVYVRAKVHHEKRGKRDLLVVTELPYQVAKNDGVIDKIKQQRANDKLTEISAVTDESSNRAGMRLVIELKIGADPNTVENQLYALTPLQATFSIINIALVNGQPKTLGLKEMIGCYIDHRVDVTRRRTAYKLQQAQQEAHRIEGLIYAVCDLDEVIRLIRSSRTRDEAIEKLMQRGFRIPADHEYAPQIPQRLLDAASTDVALTRVQAEAIGRLQLIQLVGLEIEKLVSDYAKLVEAIEEYEAILASEERVNEIIRDEVANLKTKYGDARRTELRDAEVAGFDMGDMIAEHQVAVTITHAGYVKRLPVDEYKTQGRGGKGVIGAKSKDEDFTTEVFVASSHDDLLCFTDTGRVFKKKVYEIPEGTRTSRGRAIVNLMNLAPGERVVEFMPIADFEKGEDFLLFASENGLVKRTALADYRNVHSGGLIAVGLKDGDSLVGVKHVGDDDHVILGTSTGMAIRFKADDARAMGRNAAGVKGINLGGGDRVV
ncbi:MAG: DNA gyrase subunit A, partial [Planctomycetota bacterium]